VTGAGRLRTQPVQTYVAEIEGRAIFAFRAVDDTNAQAWLDVNAVMRHALETLQSNGRRIWNGQAQIRARKARPHEATIWSNLSGEVAVADPGEETDSITVWLIPTSTGRHLRDAP
jgi:hypothetical protein